MEIDRQERLTAESEIRVAQAAVFAGRRRIMGSGTDGWEEMGREARLAAERLAEATGRSVQVDSIERTADGYRVTLHVGKPCVAVMEQSEGPCG